MLPILYLLAFVSVKPLSGYMALGVIYISLTLEYDFNIGITKTFEFPSAYNKKTFTEQFSFRLYDKKLLFAFDTCILFIMY